MGLTITISGMIGFGKSTLSEIISDRFEVPLYKEPIDSPILNKFYTATPEEQEEQRYPFLLQLDFLARRYGILQDSALTNRVGVMDRSLHEDYHFAKVNTDMGNIKPLEFQAYVGVYEAMMKEYNAVRDKHPLLMVFLTGSFETSLERIKMRGRDMELSEDLMDYYYQLWSGYEDWVDNHYNASEVYKINIDELDFLNNKHHQDKVLKDIQYLVNEKVSIDKKIYLLDDKKIFA